MSWLDEAQKLAQKIKWGDSADGLFRLEISLAVEHCVNDAERLDLEDAVEVFFEDHAVSAILEPASNGVASGIGGTGRSSTGNFNVKATLFNAVVQQDGLAVKKLLEDPIY